MEDKRVGVEVDRLGSSQVMQGIFVSQGVRDKEGGVKAKRDQHPEIESHAEVEPKKRKKRLKSSTSEDEPVKHLDCLHKINDIIAELEKKVATDPPKITKPLKPDPHPAQPEVISYPQPGVAYSLNRPTSPHNIGFPNPNKLSTAPAWLGLTVAPGSVSTAIHPVSNPLVPSKHTEAVIDEMSEEEDESPIKKSLFTDIFDHDERPVSPENDNHHIMAANKTVKNDSRRELGAKLSNLLQDRILNKTRGKDIGSKHRREKVDNSRDRTTSQSRSRSREINISKRARNSSSSEEKSKADRRHLRKKSRSRSKFKSVSKKRHHSRSRSRFSDKERSKKKRKSRSRSRFSDIDEEKMRKTIEKKKRKSRSRSRFIEKGRPKKKKSSSRSKIIEKERSTNNTYRSRSRQKDKRSNKKRRQSRSKSQSRQKKTDRSRKQSRSKSHNSRSSSSSVRSKRGNFKKIKRSCYPNQQNKTNRSDSRQKGLNRKKKDHEKKSGKDEINRKQSNDSKPRKERSNSKTTERRQQGSNKFEKKNEDVKDKDDLRNYIDKLKRKEDSPKHEKNDVNLNTTQSDCDTDASEEEMIIRKRRLNRTKFLAAFKDKKKEEPEVNSNNIKMNEPDEDNIPIAFFEQPVEAVDGDDDASLPVVFFDAEVLHDGSSTHILQLGANASVVDKAFTFFKYMQPNLLHGDQLEQLNSDAKFELMDSLRLKTSKFDVTHSGKLNLYFKHPELGNIISEKERDVLISFISFLRSVKPGKPVILVTHRKDTVLPALLSLLTKHDLLAQFSPLVSQCCELVHLAWELHMDHLWQGARYPGLRSVAEFVDKDLQWDDGYLPCDKISFLLSWLVGKMRREHKLGSLDRFVEQCGGVGVMDYMTVKYNLVQTASGCRGGVERPGHVEVVRGSDQWGRKMRIDLKWKEDAVFTEERSNRRTPLPEPDSLLNDGEHHIRILKPGESKQFSAKTSVAVTAWSDKSYNTYLPPGVVKISPLSTTSILLRIPALKPRISELLGVSVLVQQNPEFTHCRILKSTEVLTQPKNSMFPIVEAMLENTSKEEISLDSKIINFAVASIKIDDKYEA
eukprot:TRINITY_DN15730_c0_g1_i1.p1 TRINITY_DN15730_c0_g1~~TRINITY_DN15730_c0_g1_i1.p1  ORF type:complete len:1150 (-),score=377.41 TRINITY_DN15730_c0_g1_i1:50-3274(-)